MSNINKQIRLKTRDSNNTNYDFQNDKRGIIYLVVKIMGGTLL